VQDLDTVLKTLQSPEYGLWTFYNRICDLAVRNINSRSCGNKKDYLKEIHALCIEMAEAIKKILGPINLPTRLVRSIDGLVKPTFTSHYLNMTQLFQQFVHIQDPALKAHRLSAMYYLLIDMAEVVLLESNAVEPSLNVTGD
jgi:hypothetical protein